MNNYICCQCKKEQQYPDMPITWCKYCFYHKLIPMVDYISIENTVLLNQFTNYSTLEVIRLEDNGEDSGLFLKTRGGTYFKKDELITLFDILINHASDKDDFLSNKNLEFMIEKVNRNNEVGDVRFYHNHGVGYAYLAQSMEYPNCYKIGLSKNPEKRVKLLQADLLHKIPSDDCAISELKLHTALKSCNAIGENKPKGVEWFKLTEEQINYIKTITKFKNNRFYFNGEN